MPSVVRKYGSPVAVGSYDGSSSGYWANILPRGNGEILQLQNSGWWMRIIKGPSFDKSLCLVAAASYAAFPPGRGAILPAWPRTGRWRSDKTIAERSGSFSYSRPGPPGHEKLIYKNPVFPLSQARKISSSYPLEIEHHRKSG